MGLGEIFGAISNELEARREEQEALLKLQDRDRLLEEAAKHAARGEPVRAVFKRAAAAGAEKLAREHQHNALRLRHGE